MVLRLRGQCCSGRSAASRRCRTFPPGCVCDQRRWWRPRAFGDADAGPGQGGRADRPKASVGKSVSIVCSCLDANSGERAGETSGHDSTASFGWLMWRWRSQRLWGEDGSSAEPIGFRRAADLAAASMPSIASAAVVEGGERAEVIWKDYPLCVGGNPFARFTVQCTKRKLRCSCS